MVKVKDGHLGHILEFAIFADGKRRDFSEEGFVPI